MKILIGLLICFNVFAQVNPTDVLGALGGSNWGEGYTAETDESFQQQISNPEVTGSSTGLPTACTSDDQNSIPHKFLLLLLADNKIDVSHDVSTGKLVINGGAMIGNCNSMLETSVSQPTDELPYTFQVKVRRPAGCNEAECSYDYIKVENGSSRQESGEFKPTFEGFLSCLQASGVYNNGSIDAEKIADTTFAHEEDGVNQSSELWFVSHGFTGNRFNGVYSENKKPNYGCFYFEDIKDGGFPVYSQADADREELNRLFTRACTSGNVDFINDNLSKFEEIRGLRETLIQVRNEIILDQVKELGEILEETESLEDVDVSKFRDVISDFKEYIIDPLKEKLSTAQRLYSNPDHSQKEELLKDIISNQDKIDELMGLSVSDFKKEMKKYLDEKAGDLIKYAQSPYLSSSDYVAMVGSDKDAPMDDSAWVGAALTLFEIQNTAFNYGRYNEDFWRDNYEGKEKYASEKQYDSAINLDRKISANVGNKREDLDRVKKTAQNPDIDYAARYQNTKERLVAGIDRRLQQLGQDYNEAVRKVRTQCAMEKQRQYWINQQACVRDAAEKVEVCEAEIRALMQERENTIAKYDGMIAKWNDARTAAGLTATTTSTAIANFTFTPTQPHRGQGQQPGQQYNGQMSQQMMAMQQQMMMQQQQRPMYQWGGGAQPYMGGGNGMGMQFGAGFGGQFGGGFGGGYGSPMGFGGYNQFGGMRGPSGFSFSPMGGGQFGGGYGYGGPQQFGGNQFGYGTMPGGQYSFGGPQYMGGPQMGGAGNFTFGF